jgi:hypothetical protein
MPCTCGIEPLHQAEFTSQSPSQFVKQPTNRPTNHHFTAFRPKSCNRERKTQNQQLLPTMTNTNSPHTNKNKCTYKQNNPKLMSIQKLQHMQTNPLCSGRMRRTQNPNNSFQKPTNTNSPHSCTSHKQPQAVSIQTCTTCNMTHCSNLPNCRGLLQSEAEQKQRCNLHTRIYLPTYLREEDGANDWWNVRFERCEILAPMRES